MEKYLSIGEVVKMKGISHRALRHYDDLGILVPAYVNEDSGYRYYSKNQMLILDIITLCVDFGIPLKQFKNYMLEDGSIDLQKMSEDSRQKALEMQKKIKGNLYLLDSLKEHFKDTESIAHEGHSSTRNIKERYFLTLPTATNNFETWQNYWSNLTTIYKMALNNNFVMSVNQGLCFINENNISEQRYFVEVKPTKTNNPHILVVPQADFLCEFFDDECFLDAVNKYTAHEHYKSGSILIFSDVFERKIVNKPMPFEVQLMLK